MRLAYLILAHHKPRQLAWLLDAIHDPGDVFALHVDGKASDELFRRIEALAAGRPNVHLLARRPIVWGGWSLAAIQLEGIRTLLALDGGWGCFVNLSGQDYPLKSRDAIRAELAASPDRNHVDVRPIASFPRADRLHLRRRVRYRCFEVAGRVVTTPIPIVRRRGVRVEWKGSGWYTLSRDFCSWIVGDRRARDCIAAVRHTLVPDEILAQTLAMNGPFAETLTCDARRETVWSGGSHPETLTMRHLGRLTASDAHFARKFDEDVDGEILRVLARRIGAETPAAPA